MIVHQVFFNLNKNAGASGLEELCRNVKMLEKIPGVLSAFAGKILYPSGQFTHMILAYITDGNSRAAYERHQIHEEFSAGFFRPIRQDKEVVDKEIPDYA